MASLTAIREFIFNIYLGAERPARGPINVISGEDVSIVFRLHDRAGNVLDVTGCVATYSIARRCYYGGHQSQYAAGSGIAIGAADGKITAAFNIDGNLPDGKYMDQLHITKDGKTIVATSGFFNVGPTIQ